MDFYLTAPDGGRIHLPINPERITARTGSRMQTFEVINLGEISIPRGVVPTRFSWEGFFPGEARRDLFFINDWQSPKGIAEQLSLWRAQNTKIRLLVTETPINHDCYISTFEHTWGGGYGDAQYSIELVQVIPLVILAETEQAPTAGTAATSAQKSQARPAPPTPKTYTVKSGDTLWAVAKRALGDGSRWKEIYNNNASVIGSDPNLIYPGQVLRIA